MLLPLTGDRLPPRGFACSYLNHFLTLTRHGGAVVLEPQMWRRRNDDGRAGVSILGYSLPDDAVPVAGEYEELNVLGRPTGLRINLWEGERLPPMLVRESERLTLAFLATKRLTICPTRYAVPSVQGSLSIWVGH
jgi:hypothetical protein